MIAVTGASGKLGRLTVEGLLEKVPAESICAVVRSPEKVRDLAEKGVHVRRGDYSEPESLISALDGTDRLLLVSANEFGRRAAHHQAVIDGAIAAKVRFIAYTSVLKADKTGVSVLKEHQVTEAALRETGIPFTVLRNGWYIENHTENLGPPLTHGAFMGAAKDGRIAAASRADLAAAAVRVLTEPGHEGKTYELAGTPGYTMSELAAAVSKWAGRIMPYKDMPPEAYKQALLGAGLPPPLADFFTEADVAISRGELDAATSDLPALLGRAPRTLQDVLADTPKP